MDYYQSLPANAKWEDAAGYHWKNKTRECIVWKKDGVPGNICSQLFMDYKTGEPLWRRAPSVYRVQMSMPLSPEDTHSLRAALLAFGVTTDPLSAIKQCLAVNRKEIIPDKPQKLIELPKKLYTVQELVMDTWGGADRSIAAQVAARSKVLEEYLLRPSKDLLKIPFYLLEKWGKYLSSAQLWTIIVLLDRVFVDDSTGAERDTTVIKEGVREMATWTEEEYSSNTAKKISRWLYPFSEASTQDGAPGTIYNPWFSVFASEIRSEKGTRTKNSNQSAQIKLRVLPWVPLSPEDTMLFAQKMGFSRVIAMDAAGSLLGLEITPAEFVVYTSTGRTLRYNYQGELLFGEKDPVILTALNKNLEGIELVSDERFYDDQEWERGFLSTARQGCDGHFCGMENPGDGHYCGVENDSDGHSCRMEKQGDRHSCGMGKIGDGHFCRMALEPDVLFCVLLKLLILNLYGIKNNSFEDETPSNHKHSENDLSLDLFGSRRGHYLHWTEEASDSDWDLERILKSMGIGDSNSLREARVSAQALVACALEMYATPSEKFKSGRIAVLVSKLRKNPEVVPGPYQRLAELGPDRIQYFLRNGIVNLSSKMGDPDWDAVMANAKRDDLIELVEKLALGSVYRIQESDL
jgi:hypothetical protein